MAQVDSGNREVEQDVPKACHPSMMTEPSRKFQLLRGPLSNPLYRSWNAMIRFLTSHQVYLNLASLHGFMV